MPPQELTVEKYNYRLSFVKDVTRVIVLPPALVHFALSASSVQLSSPVHAIAVFLSIPVVYIARCKWSRFLDEKEAARRGARLVPVVKGAWPGNLDLLNKLTLWSNTRYVGYPWSKMAADTGSTTVNMRMLGSDMVVTIDPGVVKFMLATGFENFEKGAIQKERMETFLGNGIFNRDGQLWKMHRAMTRPFFARERISDFAIFERHTTTTLRILNEVAGSSIPVLDVQDLLGRFALDVSTEFLFSQCLHTLNAPRPVPGEATCGAKGSNAPESKAGDRFSEFAAAFEMLQVIMAQRFKRGMFWKLIEAFSDTTTIPSRVVKDYLTPIVRDAVEEKKRNEKDGTQDQDTLLQHMIRNTDDVEMIRDELLNILLAGRDTTSAMLTFLLYSLTLHPEVESKLREEINRCCGGSEATPESIKEMKYMRAVINETLRLFPPVPGNLRESTSEGCVFPSESSDKPYYIPPNTILAFSPLVIQRRPDLWGEDADEFNPERWMDAERVAKYFTDFAFMAFNLGPRICLGQQFAYTEASYFLASVIPRFTFSLAPEYQPNGSLPPKCWRDPISPQEVGIRTTRELKEKLWIRNAITTYSVGGSWMKVNKL